MGRQVRCHEEESRSVHAQVRSDAALVLQNVTHAANYLRQLDHLARVVSLSGCAEQRRSEVWRGEKGLLARGLGQYCTSG